MNPFWHIVVSNALIATAMAASVALIGRFWKNPQGRHLLWLCVLVKLLLPPLATIPVPLSLGQVVGLSSDGASDRVPMQGQIVPKEAAAGEITTAGQASGGRGKTDRQAAGASQGNTPSIPRWHELPWLPLLACIWAVGTLGLILTRGAAIVRFQKLLRLAEPAAASVSAMTADVARQLGLSSVPRVVMLPVRLSPLVWAIGGRPRIVLPTELCRRLDADGLRTILAHELTHVRRRDYLVRWLELLTTTLFWWHPVVWWAVRSLRELEEECCDRLVLRAIPRDMKAYATAILDTVDFLLEGPAISPLAATAIRPSVSLARRISMLKDNVSATRLSTAQRLMLAVLLAVPMATAVAAKAPTGADESRGGETLKPDEKPAAEGQPAPAKPIIGENAAGEKVLREAVAGRNFIVVPIHTNLQRARGTKYQKACAYVLINGMGLLSADDTLLNASAVDSVHLSEILSAMIDGGVRGAIVYRLLIQPDDPSVRSRPPGASDMYASWLGHYSVFSENSVEQGSVWKSPAEWQALVAEFAQTPTSESEAAEAGIGNDQVKVYAVRSPLSRWLYNKQDDCVIQIIPPLEEAKDVAETVKRLLPELKLGKKEGTNWARVLWYTKAVDRGNAAFGQIFGNDNGIWKNLPGFKPGGGSLWLED